MLKTFLVTILIASALASAVAPTTEPAEILKRCAANHDFKKLGGVQIRTNHGQVFASSRKPGRFRVETVMPIWGDTTVTLIDANSVSRRSVPGAETHERALKSVADLPTLFAGFRNVALAGEEKAAGVDCYKVAVGDFRPAWPLFSLLINKALGHVTATLWIGKTDLLLYQVDAEVTYAQSDMGKASFRAEMDGYAAYQGVYLPKVYRLSMKGVQETISDTDRKMLVALEFAKGSPGEKTMLEKYQGLDAKAKSPAELKRNRATFKHYVSSVWTVEREIQRQLALGLPGMEIRLLSATSSGTARKSDEEL